MSLPSKLVVLFRLGLAVCVVVILYLTTTPVQYELGEQFNDKFSHALAFFALSFLADYSFPKSHFDLKKSIPLLGYGVLIECIQYFLPHRDFSLLDIAGDGAGILIYWLGAPAIMKMPVLVTLNRQGK